ncbi:hypothetical protein AX13_02655 [Comamonas aquatica DA1877]|uniref:Uncharacterized protein n=1 Tax=Comamonas aquatica DA1877 TaxID=1457173 RepID=A0A014P152_9BURK|nr:hypothetical protein AX13_02655 [Comamonas aquatica DA1877]
MRKLNLIDAQFPNEGVDVALQGIAPLLSVLGVLPFFFLVFKKCFGTTLKSTHKGFLDQQSFACTHRPDWSLACINLPTHVPSPLASIC